MNTNIDHNPPPPPPQNNVGEANKEGKNRKKNLKNREKEKNKKREAEEAKVQREMMLEDQLANLPPPIPLPIPDETDRHLPSELFLDIISLLDPFMIALCHLVCKSWRLSILLNSVLYAELDLSRLGLGVEAQILQSFPRYFIELSSRAQDRLVKVSLNMMYLWEDYIYKRRVYKEKGEAYRHTFAFDLFGTLLFKSKETLRELSLVFELDWTDVCKFNLSFFPFLSSILEQLLLYPLLNSIYIKGPTGISFTLGSGKGKVRALQIENNLEEMRYRFIHQRDSSKDPKFSHVAPMIEYGKRFVGKQARFSYVSMRSEGIKEHSFNSLLNHLSHSTSSLKVLEVNAEIEGSDLWNFVIQCNHLETLVIDFKSLTFFGPGPRIELKSPERSLMNSNLKIFELVGRHRYSIDWVLTSPWLGSNLTVLHLEDWGIDNHLMTGPSDLRSILKNITKTITKITLSNLHARVEAGGATAVKILETLPNLEVLELSNLHPTFFDFFTTSFVCPNLQELSISCKESGHQSPVNCFLALLEANSSSLIKIKFSFIGKNVLELPLKNLDLDFNRLQELNLGECEEVVLWFSTLSQKFPRLATLYPTQSFKSVQEAFILKAPQLFSPELLEDASSEKEKEESMTLQATLQKMGEEKTKRVRFS